MPSNFWFALVSVGCLAPVLWAIGWSIRYVPVPIKNPFIRLAVQLSYGVPIGGIPIGQIYLYRYLTGIRNVSRDNVAFHIMQMAELAIFFIVVYRSALYMRTRQKQPDPGVQIDKNSRRGPLFLIGFLLVGLPFLIALRTVSRQKSTLREPSRQELLEHIPKAFTSNQAIPPCPNVSISQKLEGSGKVYLVPLGSFPIRAAEYLRDCYQRRFGLDIVALPAIEIDRDAEDSSRNQLVAERLVAETNAKYSKVVSEPGAFLISLTLEDMYDSGNPSWRFAFSWGHDRSAVISVARFVLSYNGQPVDDEVFLSRLRKAVARNILWTYYRLTPSTDPHTLLYSQPLDVPDLDTISENF
jgi:predicted Zn-dependent protease